MRILNKDFHLCILLTVYVKLNTRTLYILTLGLGKSFVQKLFHYQSSQFYKQRENKLFWVTFLADDVTDVTRRHVRCQSGPQPELDT